MTDYLELLLDAATAEAVSPEDSEESAESAARVVSPDGSAAWPFRRRRGTDERGADGEAADAIALPRANRLRRHPQVNAQGQSAQTRARRADAALDAASGTAAAGLETALTPHGAVPEAIAAAGSDLGAETAMPSLPPPPYLRATAGADFAAGRRAARGAAASALTHARANAADALAVVDALAPRNPAGAETLYRRLRQLQRPVPPARHGAADIPLPAPAAQAETALSPQALDRFFQQDARRYDGAFELH